MWISDGLHGPIVGGGRAVLFALLDDHSRYVPGHRWGHGEDTLGMQAALHDAVKTHGCPRKLYFDYADLTIMPRFLGSCWPAT
ncbi:hypothetical protein LAUMK13_05767 [Mycobacterium innocens]|uniref:Uncharacterized protein n=1 Tax=Mycobacterium innocens TaxID=2341083 RepID=A0A498QMV7_9MYCO|nr:hypothetical protein LAUMK13_05767 [Mycobacterium innocens]